MYCKSHSVLTIGLILAGLSAGCSVERSLTQTKMIENSPESDSGSAKTYTCLSLQGGETPESTRIKEQVLLKIQSLGAADLITIHYAFQTSSANDEQQGVNTLVGIVAEEEHSTTPEGAEKTLWTLQPGSEITTFSRPLDATASAEPTFLPPLQALDVSLETNGDETYTLTYTAANSQPGTLNDGKDFVAQFQNCRAEE